VTRVAPAPGPAMLDAWLPRPAIRTAHRRRAAVEPDRLWAAARSVRLGDTRTLGRLVRWRIPGVRSDQTFGGMLAEDPFVVLDEGPAWSLSGLCGRIWTLQRDYPHLDSPEDFRAWSRPGTARVLFGHWVEDGGEGTSRLVSEARVAPTDRVAAIRLRSLWLVVGVFERLIAAEPLALAAERAAA
jgi:hypothetical protein